MYSSQPHLAASDCRWSCALLCLALMGILNFLLISISTHSGCLQFCGVTEKGLALYWVMQGLCCIFSYSYFRSKQHI